MGISFNGRKAIKIPFCLRARAGDSEIEASINSAENRGVFLAFVLLQRLHKKKIFLARGSHSEVSRGTIPV